MSALVFGIGYLGAQLVVRLLQRGQRVVGLESGFSTDLAAIGRLRDDSGGRFELLRGDVRDPAIVAQAFELAHPVDCVYLLAAQASAHPDAAPAEYTEETNLRGPRLVFDAALREGAPPVVYASSFHVYGGALAGTGPVNESRQYGRVRDLSHLSKIYVEKLAELYANQMGLPVAPVRLGIVYGLGPVVKTDRRFVTVPHAFCLRALAAQPLEVHPGGHAPMAFLHLDDAVDALLLAVPSSGYAPANAAVEVASALDVARSVQRAARARGVEVGVRVAADSGRVTPDSPSFTIQSRLQAAGWQPTGRLDDPDRGGPGHSGPLRRCGGARGMSGRRPRILLKARPTDAQLADRLRAPVPEGMELYLHERDVSDADWFEVLAGRFSRLQLPQRFTWIIEGPVWSLDGELFGLCRNAEPDRELTRRLVRLAAHIGAVAVNVHCVDGTSDPLALGERSRCAALDRAYPFLDWYAGLCRDHGLAPLIENVPPVCRMRRSAFIFTPIGVEPRDLLACARAVPGLGITLDTSHAQLAVNAFRGVHAPPPLHAAAAFYRDGSRPQTLAAFIEPLLAWTRSAHISNAAGLLDEGLPYDVGDANLDAAVRQLAPHARYVVTEPIDPDDDHAVLKREMQARLAAVLGASLGDAAGAEGVGPPAGAAW